MMLPPVSAWFVGALVCYLQWIATGGKEAHYFTRGVICIATYCIITEIKRKK